MCDIVVEHNVGDVVVLDILLEILVEIAAVDDMNLFERIEQITRNGVAEAVFNEKDVSTVASGSLDLYYLRVTTHKCAIGTCSLEADEEVAFGRFTLFNNGLVVAKSVVDR